MKKYKAVIFDMDGTIVDTEKVWAAANRRFLVQKGIEYTKELEDILGKKIHGLSMHKASEILKDVTGIMDDVSTIIAEQNAIAHSMLDEGISFIEGFQEFHGLLSKHTIKTAIATNADPVGLSKTDKSLNLKQFFNEHMYCVECVDYICKPAPDIYLYAAQKLGIHPSECIAIEDSAHGVRAAVDAGLYCIAIDTSRIRSRLSAAHMIVDAYHEIPFHSLFDLTNATMGS